MDDQTRERFLQYIRDLETENRAIREDNARLYTTLYGDGQNVKGMNELLAHLHNKVNDLKKH